MSDSKQETNTSSKDHPASVGERLILYYSQLGSQIESDIIVDRIADVFFSYLSSIALRELEDEDPSLQYILLFFTLSTVAQWFYQRYSSFTNIDRLSDDKPLGRMVLDSKLTKSTQEKYLDHLQENYSEPSYQFHTVSFQAMLAVWAFINLNQRTFMETAFHLGPSLFFTQVKHNLRKNYLNSFSYTSDNLYQIKTTIEGTLSGGKITGNYYRLYQPNIDAYRASTVDGLTLSLDNSCVLFFTGRKTRLPHDLLLHAIANTIREFYPESLIAVRRNATGMRMELAVLEHTEVSTTQLEDAIHASLSREEERLKQASSHAQILSQQLRETPFSQWQLIYPRGENQSILGSPELILNLQGVDAEDDAISLLIATLKKCGYSIKHDSNQIKIVDLADIKLSKTDIKLALNLAFPIESKSKADDAIDTYHHFSSQSTLKFINH